MSTLDDIDLPLPGRHEGKVRVSYDWSPTERLFVTTDRLSAFDRVITSVPCKGQVLNQLAAWWFERTAHIVPNQLTARIVTPMCEYMQNCSSRTAQAQRRSSGRPSEPASRISAIGAVNHWPKIWAVNW